VTGVALKWAVNLNLAAILTEPGCIISARNRGLTQQQLADEIGVPQSTLAYWERTGKLPGREVIIRLSKVLDVAVQRLLRVDR
jgi:transcriptional regulator with XRE-family HTH domain